VAGEIQKVAALRHPIDLAVIQPDDGGPAAEDGGEAEESDLALTTA
jgi:hypothetical protein